MREIFQRLMSIGDNCELGFAQANFGADPLDLLRWAGNLTIHQLIEAIDRRFEGLGEGEWRCWLSGPRKEYVVTEPQYGLTYHTFRYEDDTTFSELVAKERIRMTFLRRKFFEDLADGERICVYRSPSTTETGARRLAKSLEACKLLWVSKGPPAFEYVSDTIWHATMKLAPQAAPWELDLSAWAQLAERLPLAVTG